MALIRSKNSATFRLLSSDKIMARMYEVYIMNRPVIFQEKANVSERSLVIREPSNRTLKELPQLIRQHTEIESFVLLSDNPEQLWMQFCYAYKEVLAAGCVVQNEHNAFLWIERNGKWDLPKGKVEPGEGIEEAAVREVEEETGIGALTLQADLGKTYHTYEEGGIPILKTTFWFKAHHEGGATAGTPQTVEGITGVHWKPLPFDVEILNQTYPSIRALVERAAEIG